MDEDTKRNMVRKYFAPFPTWALYALGFGILLLLIGGGASVLGILIAAIGGYGIYSDIQGRPSDQEIDKFLEDDFQQLNDKSLKKLGLDKSELVGETVTVPGPIVWPVGGISIGDIVYKKGNDGLARFGVYGFTCINFTDKLMGAYQCTFNFLKNVALNERTDEYFYKDVVSVSTKEESTTYALPNGEKLVHAEKFALTVSSGDRVEVILRDPAIEKLTGQIPTTRAEKAIQTIRTMLKEKKA